MKAFLTVACLFILTTICVAQAPQAFNYSAVVRNGSGTPIPNQLVKFRLSILRTTVTGTNVYTETHSTTTDGNGMVNLEIGRGTVISGVFAAIPWNNDAYFLQLEVDPAGGNTFLLMGTTQFLSVPYALNAKYAENVAAQFGLFNGSDTIRMFRNRPVSYSSTIKFFGGTPEDFTYNHVSLPLSINITPLTRLFASSQLRNASDFQILNTINLSSSIANGYYNITNNVTTTSNRVTNNSYVVNVLDECLADTIVNNNLQSVGRRIFNISSAGPLNCFYGVIKYESATIINSNPNDCNFKIKLDSSNIILDCNIFGDSISVVGAGNIGGAVGLNCTINSININGGTGKIYYNPLSSSGSLKFSTLLISIPATINYTITSNPSCNGTFAVNSNDGFVFEIH